MREVNIRLICDNDKKNTAESTVQFTVLGTVYKMDLCPPCYATWEAAMLHWASNAMKVGKADKPVQVQEDTLPFGNGITRVAENGDLRPAPQEDNVWWVTPVGANSATRLEFSTMRKQIRSWALAEKDGRGRKRWPDLAAVAGVLPKEVGLAWTREVWLPQQNATEEPAVAEAKPAPKQRKSVRPNGHPAFSASSN